MPFFVLSSDTLTPWMPYFALSTSGQANSGLEFQVDLRFLNNIDELYDIFIRWIFHKFAYRVVTTTEFLKINVEIFVNTHRMANSCLLDTFCSEFCASSGTQWISIDFLGNSIMFANSVGQKYQLWPSNDENPNTLHGIDAEQNKRL